MKDLGDIPARRERDFKYLHAFIQMYYSCTRSAPWEEIRTCISVCMSDSSYLFGTASAIQDLSICNTEFLFA